VPWWCEVRDGLSWFAYCKNEDCDAYRKLFVVNRGYGIFKLEHEIAEFFCPVCLKDNFDLRNIGFVNCEWALKGVRKQNSASRIISDGTTYDNKLHTFQEMDYKTQFEFLNIFAKRNTEQLMRNLSCRSLGSDDEVSLQFQMKQYGEMKPQGAADYSVAINLQKDRKIIENQYQQELNQSIIIGPNGKQSKLNVINESELEDSNRGGIAIDKP
jgi:predicted subunit of tRNA(5-methylaminomethyl-2-thiouridylate) methyltransferase